MQSRALAVQLPSVSLHLANMIGVVVVGILWYAGAYILNRTKGVNLSLAYREIPPE